MRGRAGVRTCTCARSLARLKKEEDTHAGLAATTAAIAVFVHSCTRSLGFSLRPPPRPLQ